MADGTVPAEWAKWRTAVTEPFLSLPSSRDGSVREVAESQIPTLQRWNP